MLMIQLWQNDMLWHWAVGEWGKEPNAKSENGNPSRLAAFNEACFAYSDEQTRTS